MKRSTLVLLVLVLAVVAAILFWERKRPGTDTSKAQEGRLFPDMPEAKEFVRLERSGDSPLVLEKAGEVWSLRSPLQDAADGYGVEGFLDQIRQVKAVRFIGAPVPWKDLGLDRPRAAWKLRTGSGTFDLAVGSSAGMGEGLYMKVGERAALAPAHLEATLLKAAGEFRARDLVPPGSGRVMAFRVVRPGVPTLAASRSGEDWVLKEPFADDADGAKVEPLLDEVAFAQASSFVEADPQKDFGLSAPRAEVTLTTDKGKTATVRFGADAPPEPMPAGTGDGAVTQELLYASVSGRPSVLVVPAKILKALDVAPDTLRSAELFRRAPFEAEELKVEGAYARTLKRDPSGAWSFAAPEKGPQPKDAGPVAEALLGLRAAEVKALDAGAPAAYVTLILKGKGFEERVGIGSEVDGRRYAYPKSRPVALLLDGEAWRRAEAALKAVPLAPADKAKPGAGSR